MIQTKMKQLFTNIIIAIRDQQDFDFSITNKLTDIYGGEIPVYDTTKLTTALFDILESYFPNKTSEIKDFCYELDFGRNLDTENPIEDLWVEVNKKDTNVLMDAFDELIKVDIPNWYESHTKMMDDKEETNSLKDYKRQEETIVHKEEIDINEIEVKDFVVISPIKKYTLEDE